MGATVTMSFGKDGKGVIIRQLGLITLGALGSQVVIKESTPVPITDDFRMLKNMAFIRLAGATSVEGDGPIVVGICNNDLSVTAIKEALEAAGPLSRNDRDKDEAASRVVFPIVMLEFSPQIEADQAVFDPTEFTKAWTYSKGIGWSWFAYNLGAGALTTGATIRILNTSFGVWV